MARRKGLGKGLGALLPEEPLDEKEEVIENEVEIAQVHPRDDQPRQVFDDEKIAELAHSIQSYGVIQPLLVTKRDDGEYTLIAGERRLRAAKVAGLKKVPVIIKEANDAQVAEISLIENIQREDLDPVEEAHAYQQLMHEFGYTQVQMSEKIGKSRSYVANTLRLLNLDEISLYHLQRGDITSSQARTLLSVQSMAQRRKMLDQIMTGKTNVREMEQVTRRKRTKDIYTKEAENLLMEYLGTKVQIHPKKKGGKIEVEYYDAEDLERIMELLSKEEESC